MSSSTNQKTILGDRYQIIRQLEQDNFGYLYLAEEVNTQQEFYVLREFILPGVEPAQFSRLQEQLELEFQALKQLQNPQIPSFRETFFSSYQERESFFVVRAYNEGHTYQTFLEARRIQGHWFNEEEVTALFQEVLPILKYLHGQGMSHGDLCPKNILLRTSDLKPVLINFAGLKKILAATSPESLTPINPAYISPEESEAPFSPTQDLYALGVSALVLLTGRKAEQLRQGKFWPELEGKLPISNGFETILRRLLNPTRSDHFTEAREVSFALDQVLLPPPSLLITQTPRPTHSDLVSPGKLKLFSKFTAKSLTIAALILGFGTLGWLAGSIWIKQQLKKTSNSLPPEEEIEVETKELNFPPTENPESELSPELFPEQPQPQSDLRQRSIELGIDYEFLTSLVNEQFWQRYPTQRGKDPNLVIEEPQWQENWNQVSQEILSKLELLSPQARRGLGSYGESDQQDWERQAEEMNISNEALYDLVDSRFLQLFPGRKSSPFLESSLSQVWYGLVFQQLRGLKSGETLELLPPGGTTLAEVLRGTLQPGEGKIYLGQLAANQEVEISLEAPPGALLSIYTPRDGLPLVKNSAEGSWSGILT